MMLLFTGGCSITGVQEESGIPSIRIAAGHRLRDKETGNITGSVLYKIDEILRGSFQTNVLHAMFFEQSVPTNGFPRQAILIIEGPDLGREGWCHVLGGDGYRGIIPDNKQNRLMVRTVPWKKLAVNERIRWIDKEVAVSTAEKEVRRRENYIGQGFRLESEAARYNFGWHIRTEVRDATGHSFFGGASWVTVGDDGRIKDYRRNL